MDFTDQGWHPVDVQGSEHQIRLGQKCKAQTQIIPRRENFDLDASSYGEV